MEYKKINYWLLVALPILLATLIFTLSVRYSFYPMIKENMLLEKKRSVKDFMANAHSIIRNFHNKELSGELTREQAQKKALDILQSLRFGFNNKDYIWVDDYNYITIMHPYLPEMVGKSQKELKDAYGKVFAYEFIQIAKEKGEGFVDYYWQWQDDETKIVKKLSYIKAFEPWKWSVGTGFYLRDVEIEAQKQTKKLGKITLIIIISILALSLVFLHFLKRVTQKIQGHQKKYLALLENSGDGFLFIENMVFVDCNQAAEKIFGIRQKDIYGKSPMMLSPEKQYGQTDSKTAAIKYFKLARHSGSVTFEWQHIRKEKGKDIPFDAEVTLSKVPDLAGDIFVAIVRDVSDKKAILRKLEESRRMLKEHTDAMGTFTARLRTDGSIIWVNKAITRARQKKRDELIGTKLFDGEAWSYDFEVLQRIKKAIEKASYGDKVSYEDIVKVRQGFLNVSIAIRPVFNELGEVDLLIFEATDITDLIKIRKELYKLNKELEERVEIRTKELQLSYDKLEKTQKRMVAQEKMASIGQLASGVAHEINNPLCFIEHNVTALNEYTKAFLEIIQKYQELCKRCKDFGATNFDEMETQIKDKLEEEDFDFISGDIPDLISETLDGIKNVTNIVKDLRVFARQSSEELEDVDVNSCVKTSLNVMKSELTKGFNVIKELESKSVIRASNDKLAQVFINMIANSTQAMPGGGEIFIKTYDKEDEVKIIIKDNGWGIKEKDIPKLFDPFFTTKEIGKGTGLGLSISLGIVEKYGGKIEVNSKVNIGTEFIISLPIHKTKEQA